MILKKIDCYFSGNTVNKCRIRFTREKHKNHLVSDDCRELPFFQKWTVTTIEYITFLQILQKIYVQGVSWQKYIFKIAGKGTKTN